MVSVQSYSPKYNYIKINRYKGAGIGFGQRNHFSTEKTPGPGAYKIPRIFDRGIKKDLVINQNILKVYLKNIKINIFIR